jgi:hypothetical protein
VGWNTYADCFVDFVSSLSVNVGRQLVDQLGRHLRGARSGYDVCMRYLLITIVSG